MIDRSKPILVFLAAGVQGSAVMHATLRRGLKVRALSRAPLRGAAVPDLEWAEANLDDAASLEAASLGVEHAVLQVPIGAPEAMAAQVGNALRAFRKAGVKSFILKLASASRPAPCEEPSFAANHLIETAACASNIPFAIVRPTMYLDNLLKPSAMREIMTDGMFSPPMPASQRIAWTSAEDCAEATVRLLEAGAMGGDHRIAGPESLTGDELAVRISAGLGRPIRYCGQSLDDFEREVDATMGKGVGRRVASKFRYFASHPEEAEAILARPFEAQSGLDSFSPRTVESWVGAHREAFRANGDIARAQ